MNLSLAPDIKKLVNAVQKKLQFPHILVSRIICFRSTGASARARARIWAFPKIWQMALKLPPYYCLEVIAEKFDYLKSDDKIRIIIHELMHIPKNFSGALLPHHGRRKIAITARNVETLFKEYQKL